MRVYAKITWITSIISVASFVGAIISDFMLSGNIAAFTYNILLAIFGSALLSAITSAMSYMYEKRRQMEEFLKCTKSIIHQLKKYDVSWDNEKKIDFFLKFDDIDVSLWDGYLRDISFFFDPHHKKQYYIFENIYLPISTLINKVSSMERHFRYHKNTLEVNPSEMWDGRQMSMFIKEIEELFIEEKEHKETDSDGHEIVFREVSNKLVHSILEELNGTYFDMMYGRKGDKE